VSDLYRDPAIEPQDEDFEIRRDDDSDWGGSRFDIDGPGGRTSNIENNERGILDMGLKRVIDMHRNAALGSSHDGFRMGIYGTNSVGDND